MEFYEKKSVMEDLNVFSCTAKEHDFIEVTEWKNGEGFDITINERQLSLHRDELAAINHMVSSLDFHKD